MIHSHWRTRVERHDTAMKSGEKSRRSSLHKALWMNKLPDHVKCAHESSTDLVVALRLTLMECQLPSFREVPAAEFRRSQDEWSRIKFHAEKNNRTKHGLRRSGPQRHVIDEFSAQQLQSEEIAARHASKEDNATQLV